MISNKTKIRRCIYCNKYFVPKSKKYKYCNRTTDSGKNCSIEGPKYKYKEKVKNNQLLNIYESARKTHYMQPYRCSITWDEYYKWLDKANRMHKKVEAGEVDISTFQEWCKK